MIRRIRTYPRMTRPISLLDFRNNYRNRKLESFTGQVYRRNNNENSRRPIRKETRKENLENEIIFLKNQFENMKCHRIDFMQEMI